MSSAAPAAPDAQERKQKKLEGIIKKKTSKAAKAGLIMPVGRVHSALKSGCYHRGRLSAGAPIFLCAALQYLLTELMELSALKLTKGKKEETGIRITPRRIMLAISEDAEYSALFRNVKIPNAGIAPTLKARKVSDFKNEHMGVVATKAPVPAQEPPVEPEKAAPNPKSKKANKKANKKADKKAKQPKDTDMVDDGEDSEEDAEY